MSDRLVEVVDIVDLPKPLRALLYEHGAVRLSLCHAGQVEARCPRTEHAALANRVMALPPRQSVVLGVFARRAVEQLPPPTLVEVSAELGAKSRTAAHDHFRALGRKGLLVLGEGGRARSTRLADGVLAACKVVGLHLTPSGDSHHAASA